jgi:hypothetical protein
MSGHSPGVGRPRKTRRDDARAAIREDAEARVRGEFDLVPTASTDAQGAPASVLGHGRPLRNMSEVRHFFRTNTTPIYFVGATPFNLLGLDRWVRNFTYITYYDGWDGVHPRVFSPSYKPYIEFESGEEINSWLLTNAEVRAHIASRTVPGVRPKIVMVFCDAEVERICDELGYDLILPSTELREHLDSKLGQARDDGPLRSDRHSPLDQRATRAPVRHGGVRRSMVEPRGERHQYQAHLRHRRRRLLARQGPHRLEPGQSSRGPWAAGHHAEARPVSERRSGHDEPVSAR